MKELDGHLYETHRDWYPVVIRNSSAWMDNIIHRPAWLKQHCRGGDYDAWCHPDDELTDRNHRSVYFFREERIAVLFALRWS